MESEIERAMLQEWASGNSLAGEMVVRRYMPFVYNLCLRLLRDSHSAEDATQDTFVNICRTRQRLSSVRDLKRWLCTVATNVCLNLIRRKNHRASPVCVADVEGIVPHADPVSPAVSSSALLDAIDALPERARLAMICRIYFDLSIDDAAEVLGTSPAAYRVLVHRGLKLLRVALKGR